MESPRTWHASCFLFCFVLIALTITLPVIQPMITGTILWAKAQATLVTLPPSQLLNSMTRGNFMKDILMTVPPSAAHFPSDSSGCWACKGMCYRRWCFAFLPLYDQHSMLKLIYFLRIHSSPPISCACCSLLLGSCSQHKPPASGVSAVNFHLTCLQIQERTALPFPSASN